MTGSADGGPSKTIFEFSKGGTWAGVDSGITEAPRSHLGKGGLRLQFRDERILRICLEQGFLFLEHIEEFFFSGSSPQAARERILELEKAGFIERHRSPLSGTRALIRLTDMGMSIAKPLLSRHVPPMQRLVLSQLNHDAYVSTARLALEKHLKAEAKEWIPERAIRLPDMNRVPDGVLILNNGISIAIEVENSIKGASRFRRLLLQWMNRPTASLLLYVATSESIEVSVVRRLSELEAPEKIRVVNIDSLRFDREPECHDYKYCMSLKDFVQLANGAEGTAA